MRALNLKRVDLNDILFATGFFAIVTAIRYVALYGFQFVSVDSAFVTDTVSLALFLAFATVFLVFNLGRFLNFPPRPDVPSFLKYVVVPSVVLTIGSYLYEYGFTDAAPGVDFVASRIGHFVVLGGLYFWNFAETEDELEEAAQTQTSK